MQELKLFIEGMQATKILELQKHGGRMLSLHVEVEMPDKSIACVDDWGRVTWRDLRDFEQ